MTKNSMNLDSVLLKLSEREERAGCYKCKVSGIHVYSLVRFVVRNIYLKSKGLNYVENPTSANFGRIVKSIVLSSFHLVKIILSRSKYDTLFYPFLRLDCVDGNYLDKFTDPVIECCDITDNYIIFERGIRGEHPTPRLHSSKVVYTDIIEVFCDVFAKLMYKRFYRRNKEDVERLFEAVEEALEGVDYQRKRILIGIYRNICFIRIYEWLLKKMNIKKIFAPARSNLLGLTYISKRNGILLYEFQHGITYGETALYSGYRDPDFTPDYFLAYGDTPPRDVYGIEEDKMINIGWAFQDYLKKLSAGQKKYDKGVLVISNPCTTDKVLEATFRLADAFKDIHFVVRPHPVEVVTQEHINAIAKHENVTLQDWHINVALAMQSFDCIIGESSTVLYEALNDGKKVARFCFEGFTPEYLTPEDEECFWKVNDIESFKAFMDGRVEDKKSMKIYSKFDKELFLKLYNA